MNLDQALPIAEMVQATLAPHCEPGRCVIGGSIRREKPEVKDIEIVCIPKQQSDDLFKWLEQPSQAFCKAVETWPKMKGSPLGRYTQRLIMEPAQIKLDVFMARPHTWGLILAIRTGPAEYSHQLAMLCNEQGYKMYGGELFRYGHLIPVPEERQLFDLLKTPYLEPKERGAVAAAMTGGKE